MPEEPKPPKPKFDLKKYILESQLYKSMFRHGYSTSDRDRALSVMTNVFFHLHPVKVRKSGARFGFTWCAGGLSFFVFLTLVVSGILLMFYYRPTVEHAYDDIMALRDHVPFGIMRELHRWGAHAMIITVWLHMFRVFMTGSYKPPREFNWVIGVILLVLTFLLSFTGYLLPWDQLAFWAITVGSEIAGSAPVLGPKTRFWMLGGFEVGPESLIRFYTLHVIGLPLLAAIFMAVHFWRIRRDGGLARPL